MGYKVPWPSKTIRLTNKNAKFTSRQNATAAGVTRLVKRFVKTK